MAQEVLMPKLGLTMTEGTIEEWKYKEGDSVKKGDILFSVATDKLTNDVEAEADGVLLKILLPEGETAPCKAVIAYIGEAGEVIAEGGASAESTAAQAPASSAAAVPAKAPAATRDPGTPVLASPAAKKLAKEKNIPLQHEPMGGRTGTDADELATAGRGIKMALLSIPLRSMHTVAETIDPEDAANTARLMALAAKEGF